MNPPVAQRVTSYEPGSKAQEGNRRIQTGQWSVSIQSRQGNKLHAPLARRGNLPLFLGLQPRLILIAPLALRRGNERCLVMHIVPALRLRPCRFLATYTWRDPKGQNVTRAWSEAHRSRLILFERPILENSFCTDPRLGEAMALGSHKLDEALQIG